MKHALTAVACMLFLNYSLTLSMHAHKEQLLSTIERAAAHHDTATLKKALNLYALDSTSFLNDYNNQHSLIYQLSHGSERMDDQQKMLAVVIGVTALIPLAGLSYWYEAPYSPSGMISGIVSTVSLQLLYAQYYQLNQSIQDHKQEIAHLIRAHARKMTSPRTKQSLLQSQLFEQVVNHDDQGSIAHNIGSRSKRIE